MYTIYFSILHSIILIHFNINRLYECVSSSNLQSIANDDDNDHDIDDVFVNCMSFLIEKRHLYRMYTRQSN